MFGSFVRHLRQALNSAKFSLPSIYLLRPVPPLKQIFTSVFGRVTEYVRMLINVYLFYFIFSQSENKINRTYVRDKYKTFAFEPVLMKNFSR